MNALDQYPDHLRPVPHYEDPSQAPQQGVGATAVETSPAAEPVPAADAVGAIPGLTPPLHRGHSRGLITDVLVELGYASQEAVQAAIEAGRLSGRSAESVLLEQGQISPEGLSRATAERYGLDHVDLSMYQVDFGAAALFPVTMARRYKAVPIGYLDHNTLLVATTDPANVLAVDDVQIATGLDCQIAVATEEDVESLLGRLGTLQSAAADAIIEEHDEQEGEEGANEEGANEEGATELQVSAADAPVVKLVYSILAQAVSEGASDIHLEPEEGELRVRFRVDGVLKESAHVPRRMISAVISRLKIMSELDIAEKRVPQDGRVSVNVEERRIDLRVTTLPTQRGEGATIRILDETNADRSLDDLGMEGDARSRFERAFGQAYGAVLVTGPTGSGKSTTLYAALSELNSIEKKIITIEDPVEYRIPGINQINVNRKAGLDFARGLRSVLRADPDIVMVGEIRDAETARIAIEAALTGHLMLTTLHTNDAPGAIARLNEMGIETFLTASAVDCVVAQRLARRLCPHCKTPMTLPAAALAEAGIETEGDVEAFEPVGCPRCSQSGYRGRVGIYSVMPLTPRLKEMTVNSAPEPEIAAVAREEGMLTLREGETSLEEVLRVTA
jgi:type IV pilus assembly protein PilB